MDPIYFTDIFLDEVRSLLVKDDIIYAKCLDLY